MFTSSSNRTPIALDVQDDQIVAVQLMRRKGKWKPAATVTIQRQHDVGDGRAACPMIGITDQELAALERGLTRQGAVGRSMVLIAPPSVAHVELLELPPRGPQTPIMQLARAEMARLARWDDSTPFQMMTWDVPGPTRRAGSELAAGTSMYAAALPEGPVRGLLEQLWAAGWSVQRIVPTPVVAAAIADEVTHDALSLVVDVRRDRAALTLVRGEVAIYHRDLPDNGLSLLFRGIVADLHMTAEDAATALELGSLELDNAHSRAQSLCEGFAEALASELEASLAFAGRRYGDLAIKRLLVVGPGSKIRGLAEWLRARLEVPAAPAAGGDEPSIASCIALARMSVRTKKDAGLLPSAFRELVRREQVARLWITGAAMVAGLALIGVAGLYAAALAPTNGDEARLAGFQREQLRVDAEMADANRKLAELRAMAAFEDRIVKQPDYSALLRLVGNTMDGTTVLRELTLSDAPAARPSTAIGKAVVLRRLKLLGTAPAASVLTGQVSALRAIEVFSNVELARTSRSADGEGVSFELTLDVVPPPAASNLPKTLITPKGAR